MVGPQASLHESRHFTSVLTVSADMQSVILSDVFPKSLKCDKRTSSKFVNTKKVINVKIDVRGGGCVVRLVANHASPPVKPSKPSLMTHAKRTRSEIQASAPDTPSYSRVIVSAMEK